MLFSTRKGDVPVLVIGTVLLISGPALGGALGLAAPLSAVTLFAAYGFWRTKTKPPETTSLPTRLSGTHVIWEDSEKALRLMDDLANRDSALRDSLIRLAKIGRRSVEAGRHDSASPLSTSTRHSLCLTSTALIAYEKAGQPETQTSEVCHFVNELADLLEEQIKNKSGKNSDKNESLDIHLKVLEREVQALTQRNKQ